MSDGSIGLGLEFGLDHEAAMAGPPAVDAGALNEAIRGILKDADLEQLSRRMVRKQLEAQFQTDLSHYKDMINETILRLIEEQQQDEEGEEEEDDEDEDEEPSDDDDDDADEEEEPKPRARSKSKKAPAPKKKATPKKRARRAGKDADDDEEGKARPGGGFNMELLLSPELASVMGSDRMARPQIVKNLWAYIREHNLQDPKNKKSIILDDKLRGVFQRDSFTMFSMNKFVKRHVRKPDDMPAGGWADIPRDGVSSDEEEGGKTKKKAVKRKKKNRETEDGGETKRANPFNVELSLSPELASVVGSDRMARPQIVKNLWAYIHEHELQDPNDKRSIILDDRLRRVFQRDSFTMFSMNKYIKRHARKPADVPAGGWADVPRDGASSGDDSDGGRKKKARK